MSDHAEIERRLAPNVVRVQAAEGGRPRLRGRAIVFHSPSVDLGGFTEIIAPEAVDRTLREALDVRALFDHDSSKVLGRTTAGTLELRKGRTGLEITIDPPNTSYARDVVESVTRGDISGMSFGFRVLDDEWRMEGGEAVRTVTDMTITEVSIVTFPAYAETDVLVAQRSLQAYLATARPPATGRSIAWLQRIHQTRMARR